MATSSKATNIFWGYNLPWVLWTAAALLWNKLPHGLCPVNWLLGFCPGCGLTRQYHQLLMGQINPIHPWLLLILLGFFINFLISLKSVKSKS